MAAEKLGEASSSKAVEQYEDMLEESLGLASESFDPMRVIYAPSLEARNDDIESYKTVSQFMEHVNIEEENTLVPHHDGDNHDEEGRSQPVTSVTPAANEPERSLQEGNDFTMNASVSGCSDKAFDGNRVIQNVSESLKQTKEASAIEDLSTNDQWAKPTSCGIAAESLQSVEPCVGKSSISESISSVTSMPALDKNKHMSQQSAERKGRSARPTVLTQLEHGFQEGPMSILRRSVQEKIKVRVWTRSVRNIRGISTGYVVAFDKHMNLAMIDVDEVYRKPVGKHQRKKKKPIEQADPPAKNPEPSTEGQVLYPNTPWQPLDKSRGAKCAEAGGALKFPDVGDITDTEQKNPPADGIGNLPSLFSGMHLFGENEETRLLGVKSHKLLTRHLNQVLLRGEHVVAVSLVELGL